MLRSVLRVLLIACVLIGCRRGSGPSQAPSCIKVADHVLSLIGTKTEHAADVRAAFLTRCEEDRWSVEVRSCVVSTTSLKDPRHCKDKLSLDHRAHLDGDLLAARDKELARRNADLCKGYTKMIEKLTACDKLPQASRDAIHQAYDAMKTSATELKPDAPRELRQAIENACTDAAESLRQTLDAVGCTD